MHALLAFLRSPFRGTLASVATAQKTGARASFRSTLLAFDLPMTTLNVLMRPMGARMRMKRLLFILAGVIVGYAVGAATGIFFACMVAAEASNLCGLVGIYITGPIGALIGIVAGFYFSRSKAS
jgi:heme/copper-type cytochrome/quinol oxidase subunit 1